MAVSRGVTVMFMVLVAAHALAGCFGPRFRCGVNVEGEPDDMGKVADLCGTRILFDSDGSRLLVLSVGVKPVPWAYLELAVEHGTARAAFGRAATEGDDGIGTIQGRVLDLGDLADGHLEPGQWIGLCGDSPNEMVVFPTWTVVAVSGAITLNPC